MIASPNTFMRFTTDGSSMGDFIQAGDELIAKRLFSQDYHLGDVLVFMHPELEKPVAHRLRWKKKTGQSEWVFCLSGDSHPLRYEWIHEDFIRGRVELILKKSSKKLPAEFIVKNNLYTHWISFIPHWIAHQLKILLIQGLEFFQSLPVSRHILGKMLGSKARFTHYDHLSHLAVEAKVFGKYAGRGHLVFNASEGPEIVNLEVRSRFQGLGIGKKLLHFLINEAKSRKATRLFLSVWNQSTPALHLYESVGFRAIREEMLPSVRWPTPRCMIKMELQLAS